MIDLNEIKSRINPAYQDVRGTESHERKMLCDEIERLCKQLSEARQEIADRKADCEACHEQDEATIAELRQQLHAACIAHEHVVAEMDAEIESLRQQLAVMQEAPQWATYTKVCEQLADANAENDSLRKANLECVEYFNEAQKDLAVSQLREQQLQAAAPYLVKLRKTHARKWIEHRNGVCGYVSGNVNTNDLGHVLNILTEFLALPTDTSALEAMIQKAGEVMRERCFSACNADKYPNECDKHIAHDCRLAISTLPGVTLEDFK